jgi:hypothetical protein
VALAKAKAAAWTAEDLLFEDFILGLPFLI